MKSKLELMASEVLRYYPKKIVDIGYAQEPNRFLLHKGIEVYGIDIVEISVPYTETFRCDLNTDDIPFNDEAVDAVAMGCTLAHVANPLKLLGQINRILPKGGVCVLSSPNPNYYWENVLNIFYYAFRLRVSKAKHLEHFFEFSRYNMRTIAERSGFEVVKEVGVSFHLVKTPFKFNPIKMPGIAYEIIYVLEKRAAPESFATFETANSIRKIPTQLYS